ncbi:unnamed protein product [Withania somnifera]
MEAVILADVLRWAGADATVASVERQLEVEASGGTRLVADTFISACSAETFDLVALPGGMPGSARLRDCAILQKITSRQAERSDFMVPYVLLQQLLFCLGTTCYPAFIDKIPSFRVVKTSMQVSGDLTTSRGPGTSFEFAICLLMNPADDDSKRQEFNEVGWSLDVLIPIANGSEEIEVVTLIGILRRAKVNFVVASVEKSAQFLASSGTKIGGIAGAERLHKSKILKKLLEEQGSAGRIFGAIRSSPAVLPKQGLIKDKKATAHPAVLDKLKDGVNDAQVVIDGKLITGQGLATVTQFAFAIVSKLFGHARARSVAEGLVYQYPRS